MLVRFESDQGTPMDIEANAVAGLEMGVVGKSVSVFIIGGEMFAVKGALDDVERKIQEAQTPPPGTCGHGVTGVCMACLREALAR